MLLDKLRSEWLRQTAELFADSCGKHKCASCHYSLDVIANGNELFMTTLTPNPCKFSDDSYMGNESGISGAKTEDNGSGYYIVHCPKYKANPTLGYNQYMKSDAWKAKRSEQIKRDGFQCQMCGTAINLQVHHTTYENIGNEKIGDLVTLCEKCHKKIHSHDIKRRFDE